MNLYQAFSKYQLTNGQKELLNQLDFFLNDGSTCFLLKGYAGTGKTFLMKGLTDYLKDTERNFKIAAPTGRAAKVISKKTKHKAYTIHKTIYSNTDLKEFKTEDTDGSETFKFYFDLKINEDPMNTVYIIDESSMISDVYAEGEFFRFGSGYLLQDLIRYINFNNTPHNKKLIFIGDNAQLSPVNMNFSPALNRDYLKENCNIESSEYELTEVVRQKNESGILYNASIIRESIKHNIFNKLDIKTDFNDIHKTKHEDILSEYVKACGNKISDDTIVIAYSNASVKQYNDLIRKHFFPNQNKITENDKVLLVANNYNHGLELLNGDFGFVKKIKGGVEERTTILNKKNKDGKLFEKRVAIQYRDVQLIFNDLNDMPQIIDCKIVENLLYTDQREISSNEQKAMYIDFWIRNPKLKEIKQLLHAQNINFAKLNELVQNLSINDINEEILKKIKEFQVEYFKEPTNQKLRKISIFILKDALRSDPYFNALRIKFGYAVTCHKAQGGEWDNVFLNCKTSMGYFNAQYFRWLYTGITRAKDNLFTIDEPHFVVGSQLMPPIINHFQPREDFIIIDPELLESDIPFDFPEDNTFLKHLYFLVKDCLKDENLNINNVRHTGYLEHYTISRGNEIVLFKIGYNSRDEITSIQKPSNSSDFINSIYQCLQVLLNKTIIGTETNDIVEDFDFPEQFLKEFYDNLNKKLEPNGFKVTKIEHNKFHEIYEIKKNGLTATYKFHYNGKSIFNKSEIIPKRTTGLVDEINELLKN